MIADERRGGSSREEDAAGRRGGNDESANQLGSRPSSRTIIQALTAILRDRRGQVPPRGV